MVDVALIRTAIRTVLRQILFVVANVLLVVLNVLLLRSRILALGRRTTGEQTGKSKCEHTSTDYEFCFHKSSLLLSRSWSYHHTYQIKHQKRRKVSRLHSKILFAKVRVLSAALALFQNFVSSLLKSCLLMSHWKSICIANSRDFVRRDTLLAPRLSGGGRLRRRSAKLA